MLTKLIMLLNRHCTLTGRNIPILFFASTANWDHKQKQERKLAGQRNLKYNSEPLIMKTDERWGVLVPSATL
jgi:hypothetical protein